MGNDVGIYPDLWTNYSETIHKKGALDRSFESEVAIVGPVVLSNAMWHEPVRLWRPAPTIVPGVSLAAGLETCE